MLGDYEINVKKLCTYTIRGAESREDAIIQAIDCFCNDDEFYGTEATENVTENDCEIMSVEEYSLTRREREPSYYERE